MSDILFPHDEEMPDLSPLHGEWVRKERLIELLAASKKLIDAIQNSGGYEVSSDYRNGRDTLYIEYNGFKNALIELGEVITKIEGKR